MTTTYTVLGEEVTIPVEIREAESHFAQFLVPAAVVAELIEPTGLRPAEVVPGRAICALAGVRYLDGDLGAYHELAVAFLVQPADATVPERSASPLPGPLGAVADGIARSIAGIRAVAGGGVGAHIHRLPVNQEFTCAAGRGIWGFPKEVRTIEFGTRSGRTVVSLADARDPDAAPEVELVFAPGVALPGGAAGAAMGGGVAVDAYSWLDDTLRRTAWTMGGDGVRMRPGGAQVRLGRGEMADELRRLGFPKRALSCGAIGRFRCTFGAAEVVHGGAVDAVDAVDVSSPAAAPTAPSGTTEAAGNA